jgi:predicted nucleotidyltransferase
MNEKNNSKILVRLPRTVHRSLKRLAGEAGKSLNTLCTEMLESSARSCRSEPISVAGAPLFRLSDSIESALRVVESAFAGHILGVLLFGSTARGEQTESSDVDLLFAVDERMDLNRDVYARWDDAASGDGLLSKVSPHFSRLPANGRSAGGLWLEAAIEGIVLRDPQLRISRILADIRRSIAAGEVARKTSYGVPYWVRNDAEHEAC